jgi:hypothetical protein
VVRVAAMSGSGGAGGGQMANEQGHKSAAKREAILRFLDPVDMPVCPVCMCEWSAFSLGSSTESQAALDSHWTGLVSY